MTHADTSNEDAGVESGPPAADGKEAPGKSSGGGTIRTAIGIVVGAGLGYLYYRYIGCAGGG